MRIGSLFSGAGGLDMAVQEVFGGTVVWHSEIDKAASKVLAHRYPDVPNLGDITEINWDNWKPMLEVDILCGGFPCQDVSSAGKRAGIKSGTRSGLWSVFADAIDTLRPSIVIIENVRGLLSATAHRMESDATALGDGGTRPVLRAAGAVLGDLADLGYDAAWTTLAAGDIGAPHRRERVFVVAHARNDGRPGEENYARGGQPYVAGCGGGSEPGGCGEAFVGRTNSSTLDLLPTPRTTDSHGAGHHGDGGMDLRTTVTLLPTPAAQDGNGGRYSSDGHQTTLPGEARLLGGQAREMETSWGKYEPAIRRWEQLTRPTPAPTEPNKNGNPRLSAAFSEWLMGWPAGWVTDPDIGISRNDQLKIVGNGVVPQQAAAALRYLLEVTQ
jgi:DNA (cytosine-5)-methyltransferase 1